MTRRAGSSKTPIDSSGLRVKRLELIKIRQPKERVATPKRVVDERKRTVSPHGLKPQRDLGDLDGQRVLVDSVETTLGDESLCDSQLIFGVDR